MALGTSTVQVWLHLCCPGLTSSWPRAPLLSRSGFTSAIQVWLPLCYPGLASPLLSRSSFPVAPGASAVQVWLHLQCAGRASLWSQVRPLSRSGLLHLCYPGLASPWPRAPPLCRPGFPVALGASAVQVWLPRGPGGLRCPGLASPWPRAPPLSRSGFTPAVRDGLLCAAPSQSCHLHAASLPPCLRCPHPTLAWACGCLPPPHERTVLGHQQGRPLLFTGLLPWTRGGSGRRSSSES